MTVWLRAHNTLAEDLSSVTNTQEKSKVTLEGEGKVQYPKALV